MKRSKTSDIFQCIPNILQHYEYFIRINFQEICLFREDGELVFQAMLFMLLVSRNNYTLLSKVNLFLYM